MAALPFKPDSQWVRRSFLVRSDEFDPTSTDANQRFFSVASIDYTDTRPGGSLCCNPPAARTRHADIRIPNKLSGSLGKGRAYTEFLDANQQIIHMRFGIEQHNSLTKFFTGFYNSGASQIARTGRASNAFFYSLGQVAGFVVQLASWQLLAIHFLGAAVNFLSKQPNSKFYYSKPAMPLYWNAVTTIVNHISVNRGIVPRVFGPASTELEPDYKGVEAGQKMSEILPSIFSPSGRIDVYAMMTRAKRLERQRMSLIQDKMDQARSLGVTDMQSVVREIMGKQLPLAGSTVEHPTLESYLTAWFNVAPPKDAAGESGSSAESLEDTVGNGATGTDKKTGTLDSLVKFTKAELDDASQFASFRVNATGPVQESFSNSVGESNLSSKINGMSSEARSKRFDFGQGNLMGGAVGALFGAAKDAVTSFATGVLDSVEMTGLATLAGSAFVDIPKYWQGSTAQLPHSTYTMNLVSPYHNPLSQVLNIDIPLAMILAGALPKSTGAQSYVGPFLVELFDQGRCQTRLGMIESLSITRGTGNVGFNQDGKALGVDVTFSIVDMSSILHMPITENFSFAQAAAQAVGNAIDGDAGRVAAITLTGAAFTQDTVFSDYLAVLSGMALNDQIYGLKNLKLNITKAMVDYDSWTSPSHMASFLGNTFPGRALGMFFRGTDK